MQFSTIKEFCSLLKPHWRFFSLSPIIKRQILKYTRYHSVGNIFNVLIPVENHWRSYWKRFYWISRIEQIKHLVSLTFYSCMCGNPICKQQKTAPIKCVRWEMRNKFSVQLAENDDVNEDAQFGWRSTVSMLEWID